MHNNSNLKSKTTQGIIWTAVQKYTLMIVQFISGIILARLLTPRDYGCIGMLTIFMVLSQSIVDGGFGSALIQKKRPSQEDYSTIFLWNIGMSIFMYIVLFLSAPFIANFYRIPELSTILRVQGIVLLINALTIIQVNQLRKTFQFKKIAIVSIIASFIAMTITIIMAYRDFGVWSLVVQHILIAFIPMTVYWTTCKWRPIRVFSKDSFKSLFSFGFYMFLTQILNNLSNNIQSLLIGRIYNPTTLGYYSKAISTENLASHSVSSVLSQVTYPLYAELQDDKRALINVIGRLTSSLSYITFPMMFLLLLLAKPIFVLLYSDRWLPSVFYFQVLCIAGLAACLQAVNNQAIAAIGKSKTMLNWTIIKRGIAIVMTVGGLYIFKLNGLLLGMVVSAWVIYIINAWLVSKYIGYKLTKQILDLMPILLLAVAATAVSCMLSNAVKWGLYPDALLKLLTYIVVYWGCSKLLSLKSYNYFIGLLPLILNRKKK